MTRDLEPLRRYADLIDDWDEFASACDRPLPRVVWANPLRAGHLAAFGSVDSGEPVSALAASLVARGHACEPVGWHPHALRVATLDRPGRTLEFYLGLMHVQEEISLAPALVLAPRGGERILDLCAAPGGKTAQIAASMENRGTVVANDVRLQRLRALRSNCERLGALNVVVTRVDGTAFPLEAGPFDRILLDVPCSCEGNVRDSAEVAGRRRGGFLQGRSGLQSTLLGRAWKLLRPGGILVYSTCTFAPEENELVLDHVLGDDARIEAFEIEGLTAAPGIDRWEGRRLRPDCVKLSRYWPHLNDTGGFTIARVRKETAA